MGTQIKKQNTNSEKKSIRRPPLLQSPLESWPQPTKSNQFSLHLTSRRRFSKKFIIHDQYNTYATINRSCKF